MKASLNWIKEFVDVSVSPQEIADKLTLAGLEVEGMVSLGAGLEKILTATILKAEKHPNADRLSVCEVRVKDQIVSLVCGAKNFQVGDRVALALPGVTLPNGMTLQETEIRKVKSHGMLCSKKELGLAEESEGILILSQEIPEGLPLSQVLAFEDTILEVNVTPNRGDCLSMQGLAREVAAGFGAPFQSKSVVFQGRAKSSVKVANEAPEFCPRYTCRVLRGIRVGPSPQSIQSRLSACGIRAINNVVDATNYVMLETGQPLHAFDLKQIHGGKVVIRRAKPKEKMKTLDGGERILADSDLLIADGERPLALAGVMGGLHSGVEPGTTDLLLESAYFDPNTVRRTAKRLGLQTESSYRFERGVDPNGCLKALDRLAQLILQIAGGEAPQTGKAQEEAVDVYPHPIQPQEIPLRRSQLKKIIGIDLDPKEFLPAFHALGITMVRESSEGWRFKPPTSRGDLTREIDMIEEVVRVYGYNRIPPSYPSLSIAEMPRAKEPVLDRLRSTLADWGFTEVLHYSFTSPELLKKFDEPISESLTLMNPLSEDLAIIRPALLPQMVQSIRENVFKGNQNLRLFEIRPVYAPDPSGSPPFQETWHLCLGMSGARRPHHFEEKDEEVSFPDIKGIFSALLSKELGCHCSETPLQKKYFHPKRQAVLMVGKTELGRVGELHPQTRQEIDIPVPVFAGEINLNLFLTERENIIQFQEISPFPTIGRDLNLILEEEVPHGRVGEVISQNGGPWLRHWELLDIYRGAPLPEGKKAMTYRLEYGALEKTLTDEEVNQAREELLKNLKAKIGAYLR